MCVRASSSWGPTPPRRPPAVTAASIRYVRLPGTQFGPSPGGFVVRGVPGADLGTGNTRTQRCRRKLLNSLPKMHLYIPVGARTSCDVSVCVLCECASVPSPFVPLWCSLRQIGAKTLQLVCAACRHVPGTRPRLATTFLLDSSGVLAARVSK